MKSGHFYLLLSIFFFTFQVGIAQQITTNEDGRKIIVYPDGSWEYADEEKGKNAVQGKRMDSPEPQKSQDDLELELAIRIAEDAAAAEAETIRLEEDAKYARLLIEDELRDAEDSDDYFDDEIKEMKEQLKEAKKKEKKAKAARKIASKKAKEANNLITMGSAERSKTLKKYPEYQLSEGEYAKEETNISEVSMFPGAKTEDAVEEFKEQATFKMQDHGLKKTFAKYDPDKDVKFNPPRKKCELSFNGTDEFSGKKRKDVAKQLFFTYTNEELRSVFRDRDYMYCTGYLSSLSGGLTFLTLNITIASKTAQREYGVLEKGGTINIKLLNGENVRLVNNKTNMGTQNPLDGTVTYRAQYLISSGDEKKLKKSEVDKVRIIWSSGYEDYEIYELDFFMDQFKCLE